MFTLLVCGDRNWSDSLTIRRELQQIKNSHQNETLLLIEGDCRGADKIAGYVGKELGFKVITVPAKWGKFGKSAGPLRNQQMLDQFHPQLVLAFHSDLAKSRGTKDMITRAEKAGVPIKVISTQSFPIKTESEV